LPSDLGGQKDHYFAAFGGLLQNRGSTFLVEMLAAPQIPKKTFITFFRRS
jgi:hypothetical protein